MSGTVGPRIPPFTNTYSLDFDGVDDVLSLGTPSTVGTGGINTLSFWVKANAQSTAGITNYLFSDDGSGYNWWRFFHGHGTNLYWRNINGVAFNLATNLFDGNWHNVVVIRNPSDLVDGSLRIYVDNGTPLDRTLDYRYGVAGFYNGALGTIGNNNTASSGFNGIIDEVSVWNSEITPSDVASIYNSGKPTDLSLLPTPPLNWYRMGDNGAYKDPQWLIPNNENKDKVSNYSMDFDGMDDYVGTPATLAQLGFPATTVSEGSFSISFWYNYNTITNGPPIIQSTTNYLWNDGFGIRQEISLGSNKLRFWVGNQASSAITTGNLNASQWYHILAVFKGGATHTLEVYVDGTLDNIASFTTSRNIHNPQTISMGFAPDGYAYYYNGKLDEVAIWNTDQSSNIATLSTAPTDLTPLNPSAWWKMGENATYVETVNPDGTWTIPDEVGTNDGTSNNLMADSARVGTAPSSSNNALSFNMDLIDRVEDTPQI